MRQQDGSYYLRRAQGEIARAQPSNDGTVVRFHYQVAAPYLDRAYEYGTEVPATRACKRERGGRTCSRTRADFRRSGDKPGAER